MKREKSISFFILIVIAFSVAAQKPRVKNLPNHDDKLLHFGFTVGLNTMDFKIEQATFKATDSIRLYADLYRLQPGFHVSMVSNLRLHEYLDLRFLPGIAFGQREIYYIDESLEQVEYSRQRINSSYVEFPLLLKYKAKRVNNFRPYLISGGNIRLDLAAKKDYNEEKNIYVRLKPIDYYYEIGVGFDSYLMYFKLSTELKYSIGMRDVLLKDDKIARFPEYENALDQLFSRLIMLSFHFE